MVSSDESLACASVSTTLKASIISFKLIASGKSA
ncbi:Uncharacterised protein [Vibrio cholerae]|nr:Uncharacterised protein [Vibrio cholerae]